MNPISIKRRVLVALGVLGLSLVALAGVARMHYTHLIDAQDWDVRTYKVLAALHDLDSTLNSGRGVAYCASTGNPLFVVKSTPDANYERDYRSLSEMTQDSDIQQQNLAQIDAAWTRWQTEAMVPLMALCNLPPGASRPGTAEIERLGTVGNMLRDQLEQRVQIMERTEENYLSRRQVTLATLQHQTAGVLNILAGVTALLALLAGASLVKTVSSQDVVHRTLEAEVEQRRMAEKRLTASETRVRAVLDNVPDGIITIDSQGIVMSLNPSAEAIFRYSADEVVGRNVSMLMPEPTRSNHNAFIERHQTTGESRVIGRRRELVGARSDGSRFALDLAITEIWIDGERLYTGIVRDITETKQRNEEIKRFKTMLDNTLDMIFMFDPVSLMFVYANRGAEEALGYSREELLRLRASDLTPGMSEHVFRSHIAQLSSGSRPWLSYEATQRGRDGTEVPTEVFLQLVRGDADDPGLFIAIVRDLTERRRIDRMKSDFIAIIGHELRTPLTSIRGSLGLLVGGAAGELPERVRSMVEIAHHNSERLVRLINDMLDMEKIESGKMRFDMRPLELATLVLQALDANRGYGQQYQVEYLADAIDPELRVYGDFDRLMQVMNNLLSNAAKFSPAQSRVEVSVEPRGTRVRVSVTDHGPGIPEDFRTRMFERFSQADTSDARQKGGTGLGLSISRAIIERHDGLVGYDSVAGGGSAFWFEIPLWHTPVPHERLPDSGAARILVCEDDADVAHLLAVMLRESSYQVDVVYSAEQARNALDEYDYAVITLDIALPGQDGIAFLRDLGGPGPRAAPPVIVVSGRRGSGECEIAGGHPVLAWLDKPIDRDRLVEEVRRAVGDAQSSVHLLHVEDDPDVRAVLHTLVGVDVKVSAAANVAQATQLLKNTTFDLVVLDVGLPDASGLEILQRMEGPNAHTPVLVFSAHDLSSEAIERVAAALVKSRTSNQELLDTIRRLVGRWRSTRHVVETL